MDYSDDQELYNLFEKFLIENNFYSQFMNKVYDLKYESLSKFMLGISPT